MGVIYKITNKVNGKIYIGETTRDNPNERWMEHKRHVINGQFGCRALYSAMTKYGIDNFEFKIMFFCFNENIEEHEIQMIEKLNTIAPNGYNILKGGKGGGFIGKKHTDETKEKLREHFKKKYEDVKEREKMSVIIKESMKNMSVSISERLKRSEKWQKAVAEKRVGAGARPDGKLSDETKEKIRKSVQKYYDDKGGEGHKVNIEKHREAMAKAKGIAVSQYDSDNKLIKTYISASEAERETNISDSTIRNAIKHGKITKQGYFWKTSETT